MRSGLFVPAGDPRKVRHALDSAADAIILDLEDSIPDAEKARARDAAGAVLDAAESRSRIGVRVNAPRTRWCHEDLLAIAAGPPPAFVLIPAVQDAADVHFVSVLLDGIEAASRPQSPIRLGVLVETASAAVQLADILEASPRISTAFFGPGDYALDAGSATLEIGTDGRDEQSWLWIRSRIVAFSRAAGVSPIDGPYGRIGDAEGLSESTERARLLGFDGKLCIHPEQVETVNRAFSASTEAVERAKRYLAAYRQAVERGQGVATVDGSLVDEVSVGLARRTLGRRRATGAAEGRSG